MTVWEWSSAASGTAIGGVIAGENRTRVRCRIEDEMQSAGALSALACEIRDDIWVPTGNAMIAVRTSTVSAISWRDVTEADMPG